MSKIFIIGIGVMGGAIAQALAKAGQRVFAYNRTFSKAKALMKFKNISAEKDLKNLVSADFVIVGVKPQDIAILADQVRGKIKSSAVIISLAAGLKIKTLQKFFKHKKIVRIVPTLAFAVGQGIALWRSQGLSVKEKKRVKKIFDTFTENYEAKNDYLIDVGNIIYASAKGYFFFFAQALEEAAVKFRIPPQMSRKFVEKVFLGSALLQNGQPYQKLIQSVATKGGITEAAIKVLKKRNLDKIVFEAVSAGVKRTKELSYE